MLLSHIQLSAIPWTIQSMEFSRQKYWNELPCPPPGDLPNPGIKPRSPTLQVDSLLSEPPAKPKNTGVCSLSLLQGICPTQESNWGLLHCKQILYQLSYQGSSLTSAIIKPKMKGILQRHQNVNSTEDNIIVNLYAPMTELQNHEAKK